MSPDVRVDPVRFMTKAWVSLGQEGMGCHCPETSFALSSKRSAPWETKLGCPLGPTPHQEGSGPQERYASPSNPPRARLMLFFNLSLCRPGSMSYKHVAGGFS